MAEFDIKKAEELEEKYDSALQTRQLGPWLLQFSIVFLTFICALSLCDGRYRRSD